MKYLVSIMVALFIVSGFSMAYAGDNQNKKCQNVVGVWVDCSSTTDNSVDRSVTNNNTATGGTGYGGSSSANAVGVIGGSSFLGDVNTLSPSASATGGSVGDIRNDNDNRNYNTNINSHKSEQGQAQGQLQGQSQTGIVKNDITIEDNRVVNQKIVDFNHITPDIGRTSAEHKSVRDTMRVKAVSDIDGMLSSITLTSARKLGEDTKDYKMFKELLFENDFRTSMLTKGAKGEFMGSIILTPTGSKVTLGGMSGRAYEAAMDAGATHWELHNFSGQYTEGSKAGLDFGSAASVVAKANGSAVIAPGATLGYSTAWSNNEYRPGVVIDLYFDRTMKITPVAKTQPYISR